MACEDSEHPGQGAFSISRGGCQGALRDEIYQSIMDNSGVERAVYPCNRSGAQSEGGDTIVYTIVLSICDYPLRHRM